MPITKSGKSVLKKMRKTYGAKKGKQVFYASINKGKKGSAKWHGKSKKKKAGMAGKVKGFLKKEIA